jgi:glycosyltransferase involved in cell wall biosynthesis
MLMNNPFISVIIPVYQVEAYLRRCLDSVINQTLREIEIICINDASPDGSLQILEEYAAKDNRIKIITFEQNKGVSVARNTGVEMAQGKYIGFVDSDDYVDLDFYEKLYFCAKKTNADIVNTGVSQKEFNGQIKKWIDNNMQLSDKILFSKYFFAAIYKKVLLIKHQIKFPQGIIYCEDTQFSFIASFSANKVETIRDTLYHHIRRENSADSRLLDHRKIESFFSAWKNILRFYNQRLDCENDYMIVIYTFVRGVRHVLKHTEEINNDLIIQNFFEMKKFFIEEYQQAIAEDSDIQMILQGIECDRVNELRKYIYAEQDRQLFENLRNKIKNGNR